MMGKRDISIKVNYPQKEENLKGLQDKKARIEIEVLKEKYGEMVLEQYVSSIREKR
ncbi:TPA: hypothetical protein PTV43_003531 [Clostridium botulinum]|uniref:hypothetical protein n=1 Tax=Clostridium botulinum TaxID=1491 RepID=UPI001A9317E1|nr:hypothetical protein [Clostridium botulinum]HDK7158330.1 hypothetical protein [Clostridium botulinum]